MKNKKGFTLVELLAVMTLLLIITMLAYPNFAKLSTKVKNKFDYSTKLLIESAAKIYVNNNQTEITNDYTVDNITLEVSMLNKNAINLYEKLGFKKIAVRKNYYKDSDGILMLKEVR